MAADDDNTKDQETPEQDTQSSDTDKSPAVSESVDKATEVDSPPKGTKISSFSLLDTDTENTNQNQSDTPTPSEKPTKDSSSKKESDSILTGDSKDSGKQISSEEVKDWLKDVRPDTTKEVQKGRGGSVVKYIAALMLLMLIAGALAGGFYYYRQNVQQPAEEQVEEEVIPNEHVQEEQESEPTATPEPVDLTEYETNVLNGSGVTGEAGRVADLLEGAGFNEPNAGNADSQDYEETTVAMKEDVPDAVYEEIESALGDEYTVIRAEDPLDTDAEYDVVVTVGERR